MEKWPADRPGRRLVAELIPYARNSRLHSDQQVAQIAASIREFGFTMPILVDEEGGIIAGHARVMAATKLGYESVPVVTAEGWTEAQIRAYVIADNKLTENGSWDDDLLRIELNDLMTQDFDLALTGFTPDDLDSFLGGWREDPEGVEGAGSHTDGISTTIKVVVPQEQRGAAKDAIAEALAAAGIEHQL